MIRTVIIDDELDAIESLKLICRDFYDNIEVVGTAQTIEEGLKIIQSKQPELVFLDIDLPRGNGFDLLERLPRRKFEVILVSALFGKYEHLIQRHNILACIDKPVDIEELQVYINKLQKIKETTH